MQKSQEKRETFMELTPQILIVVLPLIFLGGFVDKKDERQNFPPI